MPFSVNRLRNTAVVNVQGPLLRGHPIADVKIELIQEGGGDIDPADGLHLPLEIVSARDLPQMSQKRGTESKEGPPPRMTTTTAVTETASPAPLLPNRTTPAVASIGSTFTRSALTGTTEETRPPQQRPPLDCLRRAPPPYLPPPSRSSSSSEERRVLQPKSDSLPACPRMLDID